MAAEPFGAGCWRLALTIGAVFGVIAGEGRLDMPELEFHQEARRALTLCNVAIIAAAIAKPLSPPDAHAPSPTAT